MSKNNAERGGIAAISAGGLVAVALIGPIAWDGLWLALAPAGALLILAVLELHAAWRPGDGRLGAVGAFVLAAGAGALLALMVIGIAASATLGLEPAWLAFPLEVAGYAFLAGAALWGAAVWQARTGPRWAAVVFAVSLPLGLGLDAATNLLPFGELFFFAGFGFYLGLGLFALSLLRLGVAARASPKLPGRQERHRTQFGSGEQEPVFRLPGAPGNPEETSHGSSGKRDRPSKEYRERTNDL
jgi:hypothetical protein